MTEGSISHKSCFLYLLIGVVLISIISAGQYVVPERKDIPNPNWLVVDVDQGKIPEKGVVVTERKVWPLLHLLPPILAWLVCVGTYMIVKRNRDKNRKWVKSDEIAPHAYYFIYQSFVFLAICLTFTIFEKRLIPVLSYGRIPAFYHAILGIIMGFPICVERWLYYQIRLEQIASLTDEPLDNFRKYIERILKTLNRSTLILMVSVALGTWRILGEQFASLTPPEKYWHTIEIAFGFAICAVGIVFWILKPIFMIFQKADLAYFNALLSKGIKCPEAVSQPNDFKS